MRRLLVIDDDLAACRLVAALFRSEPYELIVANDGESGIAKFTELAPDVVLLDLHMPGMDGMAVLEQLREISVDTPIVMMTAHKDLKTAVRATQLGANDYLTKPIDGDELMLTVRREVTRRSLQREVEDLRRLVGAGGSLASELGPSPESAKIVEQVNAVADTSFSVLITGETGTGKELIARALHRQSSRRAGTFIAIDCGAIPEALLESELFGHEKGAFTGADRRRIGQFQLARGGTFFLDEVGNLPGALQARLLRVLEQRHMRSLGGSRMTELDVRFVAATNDDLQARIQQGAFRADLYFRLAQYTISLPPLRMRRADVPHLAEIFLDEVRVELRRPVERVSAPALALLAQLPWPGNVRELRNTIRQAVLGCTGTELSLDDVARVTKQSSAPVHAAPAKTPGGPLRTLREIADAAARAAEHDAISETLRATQGNKSQAARLLQTDYKTLHLKMKQLSIRAKDFSS